MTQVQTSLPGGGGTAAAPNRGDTVVAALMANGIRRPHRPAMRYRDGTGRWQTISWLDYELAVRQIAAGLAEFGLGAGSRVAILGSNRPEWHIADLGAMANRSVTVPIYPTSSPAQTAYVLAHSGAEICFVDSHEQLGKVMEARAEAPSLRRVVISDASRRASDDFVVSFEELRDLGADRIRNHPDELPARIGAIRPDDLATIVYTSGTTGPPKGAMITHENIVWTIRHVAPAYGIGEGERWISFLPLSHIAERMMSDFTPIVTGGETWFARSLATVAEDLPECRPTVFLAVPRVWEKLQQSILDRLEDQPLPLRTVVHAFIDLGLRAVDGDQTDRPVAPPLRAAYQGMDRVIGYRIRREIGLDHARMLVSAAAPVHPDLIRWFHAIGLPLIQIYGQTEDCGPTTANRLEHNRIGTVGSAIPGVTVKLADDGEILVKGGNVCLGYLDDAKATAELMDDAGWMHTGDTGVLDDHGDLRITGRKKDLIITAAGKNIAPLDIEGDLRNNRLVSEAIVVGEGRRYLSALLALDAEELTRWAEEHRKLGSVETLTEDPDLVAEVASIVDEVNSKRSKAEWVRKFRILPNELTAAAGELTPTMKVKRAVVYDHYADVIDGLYAGD